MIRQLFAPRDLAPGQIVKLVMWPLTLVTAVDMISYKEITGHHTNDFKPVHAAITAFLRHEPVYTANLSSVDPHYLCPPAGWRSSDSRATKPGSCSAGPPSAETSSTREPRSAGHCY